MTDIINDTVETTLKIAGNEWLVSEAIVERSRGRTPDYVDMIIIPDPNVESTPPEGGIDQLIGSTFELYADNQLISERTTDAEEDSLLFTGNLANISPTGEYSYEALAYDPSQQAFAQEGDGGSIMNTTINIRSPSYQYDAFLFNKASGVSYKPNTNKASEIIERAARALNISPENYKISLSESGTKVGEEKYGIDQNISFDSNEVTIKTALSEIREQTKSEWWFDKEGVFNFGVPEPTRHDLQYITETSAGKTTPPYQSIQVIGSGASSQGGYAQNSLEIEDKIVKKGNIAIQKGGDSKFSVIEIENAEELNEPTFTYKNLSISTDEQAQNTLEKLASDLGEQQASGKVTVVGFPEVEPLDGIVMPDTESQPMGGFGYGVYKVTHFLNASDGFLTEIEVAGLTGITKPTLINTESPVITGSVR